MQQLTGEEICRRLQRLSAIAYGLWRHDKIQNKCVSANTQQLQPAKRDAGGCIGSTIATSDDSNN
eukprot:scaffold54358_cov36-Cyclotella_meneghiniana.AAC.5